MYRDPSMVLLVLSFLPLLFFASCSSQPAFGHLRMCSCGSELKAWLTWFPFFRSMACLAG